MARTARSSPILQGVASSYSWVVTGDHLEAGRQNHGTRWRAFWDLSTGWGSALGLGRMDPRRDPCPRCLRNVCGAGHHPDKQCLRPRPGARKRARVIAEACEYPQASCQSGPGSWDLSVTSLWRSGARYLYGTSIRSSGPVEGVQEQRQHGRAFGLGICPRGEEMFPGAPWWRGNTRRGQPGRLKVFPEGYSRGYYS